MDAAKVAFSQQGYAKASIRDIAADAGITAALVLRYFGSKPKLFEKAVAEAFDLGQVLGTVDRSELGAAIAAQLFSKQQDVDLTAMMLLAATDPTMSTRVRRLAQVRMLQPMIDVIGGRDAERRAALIISVATGIWFYRFKLVMKPLAENVPAAFVAEVAQIFQRLIDEPE